MNTEYTGLFATKFIDPNQINELQFIIRFIIRWSADHRCVFARMDCDPEH